MNRPTDPAFELLARHCGGDRRAFAELVAALRQPVYTYLRRCGVDAAASEDLLQEIFVRVLRHAAAFTPDAPVRAWVFTIAANVMRSHFRRLARQQQTFVSRELPERPGSERADAGQEAHETAAIVAAAVATLPLLQREVLVLTAVTDMSREELGEVLGLPVNTVKTNLRRARLAVATALARAQVPAEER